MALNDPYASTDELRDYLGIPDITEDILLDSAVTSASRGIEDFCQRQFNDAGTATARIYRPIDGCLVKVDDFSVTTGLVVKTDVGNDGVFESTWLAGDYELEPLNGVVDGRTGWPYWKIRAVGITRFPRSRRASVEVTARWGWASVPPAVKQACLIIASETFKLKDAPFGIAGYSDFGPVRVRDNPMARAKLTPYVRDAVLLA